MDANQQLINLSKDILYLVGSVLGIIGFIRTLKKRDYVSLNYKTDFGNEVEPYVMCLKGDMYNLSISTTDRAVMVQKYPSTASPSFENRKKCFNKYDRRSSFYPIVKEMEFLVIDNKDFEMGKLHFKYEDKYSNHYRQGFTFDNNEIGALDRIKRTSRSCYRLTKRRHRFLYIWFPLVRSILKS
jgi:hypothetical protein